MGVKVPGIKMDKTIFLFWILRIKVRFNKIMTRERTGILMKMGLILLNVCNPFEIVFFFMYVQKIISHWILLLMPCLPLHPVLGAINSFYIKIIFFVHDRLVSMGYFLGAFRQSCKRILNLRVLYIHRAHNHFVSYLRTCQTILPANYRSSE